MLYFCHQLYHFVPTEDQCCYLYGSVPRNDSNCVPDGSQLNLNFVIHSPHDSSTNFTVKWFRSNTATEAITNDSQGKYILLRHNDSISPTNNCSRGTLHRDTFTLHIRNFTTTKNGYYWCQIVINGSFLQPSQYAWFYADKTNSCTLQYYLKLVNPSQIECPNVTYSTVFPPVIFTSTIKAISHNSKQQHRELLTLVINQFFML